MTPLLIGTPEVIIVLLIAAIVIFGGSRLAGIGKGAGQAIREFKEETDGLNKKGDTKEAIPAQPGQPAAYPVPAQQQIIPPQPPAPDAQQYAQPQQYGQQQYVQQPMAQPQAQPGATAYPAQGQQAQAAYAPQEQVAQQQPVDPNQA